MAQFISTNQGISLYLNPKYYLRGTTKFSLISHRLIGSTQDFPLDTRIFHSVCLISILALIYNIPLNYMVGLSMVALASSATLLLVAVVYYLSRYRRKSGLAKLIFCIVAMTLFVANFFMNAGINGPTDLFFILTMIMMVSVAPVRQYWFWVGLNLTVVLGLHYIQYLHPSWIPDTYSHVKERFVDISSAYLTVVILSLFNFYFIRRSYDAEKQSAEQNSRIMEKLNDEKNKLFSIISHDLKSPLSNVQSYLEVLLEVDISEDERFAIKKDLLNATKDTIELLNNLLNWTKGQMDGLKSELVPLNVYETLSPQLSLLSNIAANKEINLEISIDHKIQVLGNADMLQLVVRNLASNAIKFTSPGGNIGVTATTNEQDCIITVKDSGAGSPVDLRQDIFSLNSSPAVGTANEKGVGLGLTLCKEYTEAQNGWINFSCDPISGTSFYMALPMA